MMRIGDCIDFLDEKNIIEENFAHYIQNSNRSQIQINKKLINKIIRKSRNYSLEHENREIFDVSKLYKREVLYSKRKELGEIYTPRKIVENILDGCEYQSHNDLDNKKLVDLSCGAGSFLIPSIKRLIEYYLRIFNKKRVLDLLPEEAHMIIESIKNNIYGIDINPIACILAQINFHIYLYPIYKILDISTNDFKPPLFNIINENSLNLLKYENSLVPEEFDYVIGNPPYLFIRNIPKNHKELIESKNLKTNTGQYDYYQIFLELGKIFLKEGGKLGFIIPDSLLALSNRKTIRKYIFDNTKILNISVMGSQFENSVVSNIILILEKESDRLQRENNEIKIYFNNSRREGINTIEQKQLKNWNYRFLINLYKIDIQILDYLNNKFPTLGELIFKKDYKIILNRGVELTKEGKIFYCQQCKKYYPIPKKNNVCRICGTSYDNDSIENIIVENYPTTFKNSDYLPYIYSLRRYNIGKYKYINVNKRGINYKNLNSFKKRIIIRQINQNGLICASYDQNISLSSQSFYNLRIIDSPVPEFNNFYLLGLINSYLLSYYFIKSFGSYKQLFPRILIEKIKTLPIKIPYTKKERLLARDIEEEVKNILNNNYENDTFVEKQQDSINKNVFLLYNLEEIQENYIKRFITKQK